MTFNRFPMLPLAPILILKRSPVLVVVAGSQLKYPSIPSAAAVVSVDIDWTCKRVPLDSPAAVLSCIKSPVPVVSPSKSRSKAVAVVTVSKSKLTGEVVVAPELKVKVVATPTFPKVRTSAVVPPVPILIVSARVPVPTLIVRVKLVEPILIVPVDSGVLIFIIGAVFDVEIPKYSFVPSVIVNTEATLSSISMSVALSRFIFPPSK